MLATSASYTVMGLIFRPQNLRRLTLYWGSFGGLKDYLRVDLPRRKDIDGADWHLSLGQITDETCSLALVNYINGL